MEFQFSRVLRSKKWRNMKYIHLVEYTVENNTYIDKNFKSKKITILYANFLFNHFFKSDFFLINLV